MLFLRFYLKGHGETSAKLLKTISRIQKFFLAEAVSYELQTYGQAFGIHRHRKADARKAGQVYRRGLHIAEIHFQGVLKALSDLRSRGRGSWSQDHIIFVKSLVKGFLDQGLCTESFQIISVVITGA